MSTASDSLLRAHLPGRSDAASTHRKNDRPDEVPGVLASDAKSLKDRSKSRGIHR